MQKTFKDEDIEQILAEADELLQQMDPEIIEDMEKAQRAQFEEHAERLKKLKSGVQDKFLGGSNTGERASTVKECTRRWRIL